MRWLALAKSPLSLLLVALQLIHHSVGDPLAPEHLHTLAADLAEVRLRQVGLAAGGISLWRGEDGRGTVEMRLRIRIERNNLS
jgi:hypothetical protein